MDKLLDRAFVKKSAKFICKKIGVRLFIEDIGDK